MICIAFQLSEKGRETFFDNKILICLRRLSGMTNKERYLELCSRERGIALYSQPFWLDVVTERSGGVQMFDVLGRLYL